MESERYFNKDRSLTLHVHQQGDLGWAVWLNIEDIDYSGLCVGVGTSEGDARGAAIRRLEELADLLQLPPVKVRGAGA